MIQRIISCTTILLLCWGLAFAQPKESPIKKEARDLEEQSAADKSKKKGKKLFKFKLSEKQKKLIKESGPNSDFQKQLREDYLRIIKELDTRRVNKKATGSRFKAVTPRIQATRPVHTKPKITKKFQSTLESETAVSHVDNEVPIEPEVHQAIPGLEMMYVQTVTKKKKKKSYKDTEHYWSSFSTRGPIRDSQFKVPDGVTRVTKDSQSGTIYAATGSQFGIITADKEAFRPLFSQPDFEGFVTDIYYLSSEKKVLIFTGEGRYLYDPATEQLDRDSAWGIFKGHGFWGSYGRMFHAYCEETGHFYKLQKVRDSINHFVAYNRRSVQIGSVQLSSPINAPGVADPKYDVGCHGDYLYVYLQFDKKDLPSQLYQINIHTGATTSDLPVTKTIEDLVWPGMPGGPQASIYMPGVCSEGNTSYYQTPSKLLSSQAEELHIVSVMQGTPPKKDTEPEGSWLDKLQPMYEIKRALKRISKAAVTLNIHESEKPIVLVLSALKQTTWNLKIAPNTRIKKVYINGYERQHITGLPEGVPKENLKIDSYPETWTLYNSHGKFPDFIATIRKRTKLREASFQACRNGENFTIPYQNPEPNNLRELAMAETKQTKPGLDLMSYEETRFHTPIRHPVIEKVLFSAVHLSNSYGEFTEEGPLPESLRPAAGARQILKDPKTNRYYGITRHDFGMIDLESNTFKEIEFPKSIDPSWPTGFTFEPLSRYFLISGRSDNMVRFHLDTETWSTLKVSNARSMHALSYCEDTKKFYGLSERNYSNVGHLVEFDSDGTITSLKALSKPFPSTTFNEATLQMHCVEGTLYVLVNSYRRSNLFRVDRRNGNVSATVYSDEKDREAHFWPGWPGGPPPSQVKKGICWSNESPSNYQTPKELLEDQNYDLHILSVHHSNNDNTVEVHIKPASRPIVLLLSAYYETGWKIRAEPGAEIHQVITMSRNKQHLSFEPGTKAGEVIELQDSIPSKWENDSYAHDEYKRKIVQIRKSLGLRESSFQGCGAGVSFTVPRPAEGWQ